MLFPLDPLTPDPQSCPGTTREQLNLQLLTMTTIPTTPLAAAATAAAMATLSARMEVSKAPPKPMSSSSPLASPVDLSAKGRRNNKKRVKGIASKQNGS